MQYFIIENQKRSDGVINTTTTVRSGFASALSYYHDRYSKMVVTELYTGVSLMLVDEDLNVVEHATIETQYKPEIAE